MSGYESLLRRVEEFIKKHDRVKVEELLEWASQNEIGPITLSMIVNDLIASNKIKGEGNYRELEEPALPIPEILISTEKIKISKSLTKERESEKILISRKKVKPSVIKFSPLFSSIKEEESKRPEESSKTFQSSIVRNEELEIVEESPSQQLLPSSESMQEEVIKVSEEEVEEPLESPELKGLDEDLKKAIEYLNEFHSVGELRFIDDLKSLGVKNPREILYKLIDLGYVVRSPPGVIDATEKLPKLKRKKSPPSLASFI